MSDMDFGRFTILLFVLLGTAHLFGYLLVRLRQPRVVGEIFAGVLLGPALLGQFAPNLSLALFSSNAGPHSSHAIVLGFLYNLGLMLLMFMSGTETRGLFCRADRRQVGFLGIVGTGLPFVLVLIVAPRLRLAPLMGPAGQSISLLLVIGIAMAVTSIPIISKILHDLGISHTRFARLILSVAIIEDIVLWAVLAVATALAKSGSVPRQQIVIHVIAALFYFGIGMLVMPALLKRLSGAPWNVLAKASPVGYLAVVLLAYSAMAAMFDVSLVFAAFLAGYGVSSNLHDFADAIDSIGNISYGVFIPVYFAVVGYRIDLTRSFSLTMFIVFLATACGIKLLSTGLGARLARFGWHDSLNLAMALNARGGPGIVLASVAASAGIISAPFYTTLVLTAILTSQLTGAWLDHVLRTDRPLLLDDPQLELSAALSRSELEIATDLVKTG